MKFTEQEQAIIADGDLAEAALNTPAFASAVNTLSEQIANHIVGTKPNEAESRERYYNLHWALRELVGILQQKAALKAELINRAEDAQENE